MHMQVQARFEVDIKELPEQIDTSTYSKTHQAKLITHISPYLITCIFMFYAVPS